jgi:phage terminase large subunit
MSNNYVYLENSPIYSPAIEWSKRYLFLYGGAGSGKSQCAARKILYRVINEYNHRFLIVRKEKCHVRESMYTLLKDIIYSYGISDIFIFKDSEMKIINKEKNSEIIAAGLKNSEKIKSITGITGIWVEEAFELEQKDFAQLNLRLRGETPSYKQIICTFNPMDAKHWLKSFMDSGHEGLLAMQTTFYDNVFIDREYMDELISQYRNNENFNRVYIKGDWGRAYTGGEFYHGFSYSSHVVPSASHGGVGISYNPDIPLHITFDFNVHPYVTCCVWQMGYNAKGALKRAMQIDEICLAHPLNSTKNVCAEFRRKYFNEKGHKAGLFIYGDPSGKHEDTRSEKGYNDFAIIKNELQDMHPTLRVESKAPHVKSRGDFMNSIFQEEFQDISIRISGNCLKSIDDFCYLKQNVNGEKLKEKAKDEKTGIVFERYGHTSDSADYFLTTIFATEYNTFINGKTIFYPVYVKRRNDNVW